MRSNLPRAIRALRIRNGLRQVDLAARARISRELVSRLERDDLGGITTRALMRVAKALDATLVVELRWRGADLDRLIDRIHAAIQDAAAARLNGAGWEVHAEVAFNYYGDRGSCDLVAWHAPTQTLLIVEVKGSIGNLQDLLRRLDVKVRLGAQLASQLGLPRPRAVIRALVIAEGRTSRAVIARHPALFASFNVRGRDAFRWLHDPDAASGLLWFEQSSNSHYGVTTATQRVRKPANASPGAH
jgi:transcriptional regulator with XRE-family HTH domain